MDIRQLRYFAAVAEESSFSRAAHRLHMSQPPLSKHVGELERELGVLLFERNRRRVRMTDAGRMLHEATARIFGEVKRAVEETQRASRGETGRVSLAYVPAAEIDILPAVLRRFRVRHSGVRVELHAMSTPDQLEALRVGRVDVGLIRLPAAAKDTVVERIRREPFVLAVPAGHPLARKSAVSVASLEDVPLIVSKRIFTPTLNDVIREFVERAGFPLSAAVESVGIYDSLSLVAGGLGVSLLPACIRVVRREGVVYRPITPRRLIVETALAFRWDRPSESRDALISVIRSLYKRAT